MKGENDYVDKIKRKLKCIDEIERKWWVIINGTERVHSYLITKIIKNVAHTNFFSLKFRLSSDYKFYELIDKCIEERKFND